jgi:hypothetical protein
MPALFLVSTPAIPTGIWEIADILTLDILTAISLVCTLAHISLGIIVTQHKLSTSPLNDAKLFATK